MGGSYDPIFVENGTAAKMKSRSGLKRNNPVPGVGHCFDSAHDTPTSGEISRTVNTSRNKALRTVRIGSLGRCNWNGLKYWLNLMILFRSLRIRVDVGMRFFGIGIVYSSLDRKIPKTSREKNPENPEILGIGILKTRKNPESKISKIPKSRGLGSGFENPGFYPQDFGFILSLGIFIPRIRDFNLWGSRSAFENPGKILSGKSRIFIPTIEALFWVSKILSPGFAIFLISGFSQNHRILGFFLELGYPDKKPTLPSNL